MNRLVLASSAYGPAGFACPSPPDGVPCPEFWGAFSIHSAFVKNPCQIPVVVEGVVSIRSDDIGEFHCAAY